MPDVAIDSDSATINSVNLTEQGSDPATPASSHWRLYTKSGGLYLIDDTGAVTGPFGVGGGFENPMNAEGMMIVGGFDGIPTYLAPGLEGRVLTMGPVSPDWADPAGGTVAIYNSAWASPPLLPAAGELWAPSDGHFLYIREGTAWVPLCRIRRGTTPPNAASWTWVNQGGASLADSSGSLLLTVPAAGAWNWRLALNALPTVPYTVTALLEHTCAVGAISNAGYGLFWRQNAAGGSSGYLHGVIPVFASSAGVATVYSTKFTSPTASAVNYTSAAIAGSTVSRFWLRLAQDVTNRVVSCSLNGNDWIEIHSVGAADFLTPDQIGFAGSSGGPEMRVRLLSWEVVES